MYLSKCIYSQNSLRMVKIFKYVLEHYKKYFSPNREVLAHGIYTCEMGTTSRNP